jgi:hypothetical protein
VAFFRVLMLFAFLMTGRRAKYGEDLATPVKSGTYSPGRLRRFDPFPE